MISRKWVAVTGHIMVFIPEGRTVPKLNLAQVSTSSLGFGQGRGSLFVSFLQDYTAGVADHNSMQLENVIKAEVCSEDRLSVGEGRYLQFCRTKQPSMYSKRRRSLDESPGRS